MQKTSGWRGLLGKAYSYNFVQNILGAEDFRQVYVTDYIRPKSGERVLDIGCGTSEILKHLGSSVHYTGCDISQDYIEYSKKRYGVRGIWYNADISELEDLVQSQFDIVLVNGLFHHLSDSEVLSLLKYAKNCLVHGGRLSTFDPCLVSNQSRFAKFLIARDRGQNIRTADKYIELVNAEFHDFSYSIRHDLLRVPYTHIIITGKN